MVEILQRITRSQIEKSLDTKDHRLLAGLEKALNAVEVGEWNPTVSSGGVTVVSADYVKIHNVVTLTCQLTLSGTRSGGTPFTLGGVPYLPINTTPGICYAASYGGTLPVIANVITSSNSILFFDGGGVVFGTAFTNNTLSLTITYITVE